MNTSSPVHGTAWTRRQWLGLPLGACAGLLPSPDAVAQAELETRSIRLVHFPAICLTPQYLAEALLRAEGFTQIDYVESTDTKARVERGHDLAIETAPALVAALDAGQPLLGLAGIHAGCYELIGNHRVRALRDIKGRSVSISLFGSVEHVFISSIAAYVGIDPRKDIQWLLAGTAEQAMQQFIDGKADLFFGFAPQPFELRERKIGHVLLNTTRDRPWSQYFCCVLTGTRDYVRRHPVATKRAVRAILKAADLCAQDPDAAARYLVAKGYVRRHEVALEILQSLPYSRWREANPEDTLRFHALRLHEGGLIKASPQKLIAEGTDWRFLNEVKRELKS